VLHAELLGNQPSGRWNSGDNGEVGLIKVVRMLPVLELA
jgi:hypothetical protein